MKTYYLAFAALVALSACGSDSADSNYNRAASDELIEEQIDAGTKNSVDSLAEATAEGKILYPIPDTLATLLEQKQPKAKIATLPDQTMAENRLQVHNPLFLRGDFNGNNTLDYAVQVIQNDSIHILAFLDYPARAREVKVATYPATKLVGEWYSTYQLKLAAKDSLVLDNRQQKKVPLKTDGVSVVGEDRTVLYILEGNRFVPLDARKESTVL